MNCSFLFFLALCIAIVFGAEAQYPKIIIKCEFHPENPALRKLCIESVDLGPIQEYEHIPVQTIVGNEIKYNLVQKEMFDEKYWDYRIEVEKVLMNGKDYGRWDSRPAIPMWE
jgi:hypothetical protein